MKAIFLCALPGIAAGASHLSVTCSAPGACSASRALDPAAVHAGCRVLEGEKWGANHFVRFPGAPPSKAPARRAPSAQPAGQEGGAPSEGALEEAEGGAGAGKNAARNRKKREKAKLKRATSAAASGDEPGQAGTHEAAGATASARAEECADLE